MSDDAFWINVSGISGDVTDTGVDNNVLLRDTYEAVKVALRQAMDVKHYIFEKYPSIEEKSLTKNNPRFDFLKVPREMENRFRPLPVFYNKIQRHAVALQAMMQDTGDDKKLFELLKGAKENMIAILDSLEILMMALNVERMEDVFKDVMPNELRSQQAMRNVYCIVLYVDLLKSPEIYLQKERSVLFRSLFFSN